MALGTVLGGLASAGASFGLSKLFGGGKNPTAPIQNFSPTGINAGGLSTTMAGGNVNVTPSADRLGFVSSLSNTFGDLAGQISGLRGMVAPGISELRAQRLGEIENARTRAIGDLRDNLQRRRVLGSSFGQDTISRAEAEFAGQRDRAAAETTLQELAATNDLINQQFNAQRQQFQTYLDELNLEASVASGLATKATDTMGANARILAQLNMLEAQGAGKFIGQISQPFTSALGRGVGSIFSGGLQGGPSFGTVATGGGGLIGVGPFG